MAMVTEQTRPCKTTAEQLTQCKKTACKREFFDLIEIIMCGIDDSTKSPRDPGNHGYLVMILLLEPIKRQGF